MDCEIKCIYKPVTLDGEKQNTNYLKNKAKILIRQGDGGYYGKIVVAMIGR